MSESLKPNVFLLGFPKCGTTSLAAMLRTIDEVYVPAEKEPHIFNQVGALASDRLSDFLAKAKNCKYRVDATPTYVGDLSEFVGTARKLGIDFEQTKLFVMVRDPVDRFLSHFNHNASRGTELGKLEDVVKREIDFSNSGRTGLTKYLKFSLYSEVVARLVGHFGIENVCVLHMSHLDDLARISESVGRALGIKCSFAAAPKENAAYSPKSKFLNHLMFSPAGIHAPLRRLIGRRLPLSWKLAMMNANSKAGPLYVGPENVVSVLTDRLQDEVRFAKDVLLNRW